MNYEALRETPAKIAEGLHVAVRRVYMLLTMIEVDVRHDEYTIVVKDPRYFSELLVLKITRVFKKALGEDDVEALTTKPNWRLEKVRLEQIRR